MGITDAAIAESTDSAYVPTTATNPPTVSDVIADAVLERSPMTFGLMGNANSFFISSLTTRGAKVVTVRHETATVIAAQAFHLATGATATATTTFGAGFTNMLTSLAEARIARVPVVVVVGDAPTTGFRAQDIDQAAAAAAVGVKTFTVSPEDAGAQTRRAFDIAERDRVPVIVAIPYDLMAVPAAAQTRIDPLPQEQILPTAQRSGSSVLSPEAIASIQEALNTAERPLILAGRGAVLSGAADQIAQVGDRIGALFASSLYAKRIVQSPWDLGVAGGFSPASTVEIMDAADVVLVVGASLNLYQMRYNKLLAGASRIIQIDVLPKATHDQVTDYVRADAAEFLKTVLDGIVEREPAWRNQLGSLDAALTTANSGFEEFGPDGRLDPRALMVALDGILPAARTITQDTGHFMGWAARHLDAPDPLGMQLPGLAFHSIGLGLGAGLGIAHARPERLPIVVCGDGGAAMELAELDTLARTVPSAIVLILNDAAYGMEVHQYGPRGLDLEAMVFAEQDFSAIARAMGAKGLKLRTLADLAGVEAWLADGARGVLVVDAAISKEIAADWLHMSNEYHSSLAR